MGSKPKVWIILQYTLIVISCVIVPLPLRSTSLEGFWCILLGVKSLVDLEICAPNISKIVLMFIRPQSTIGIWIEQCIGVYSKDPQEIKN
jgi:hypothetical protein